MKRRFVRRRVSAGYTLIEMLISVVLVAVLMVAVWGLLSTYTSLQTAGRAVAEEQQLVRSVLQMIRHDATSVPLDAASRVVRNGTEPSEAVERPRFPTPAVRGSAVGAELFAAVDSAAAFERAAVRPEFRGREDVLRLVVPMAVTPVPDFSETESPTEAATFSESAAVDIPEFQVVILQFQRLTADRETSLRSGLYRIQASTGQFDRVQRNLPDTPQAADRDELRAGRAVLESLLFQENRSTASETRLPGRLPSCDWIPDVVDGRFEYWDGANWQSVWDSRQAGGLPVAVRVTLDVVSGESLQDVIRMNGASRRSGRLEHWLDMTAVALHSGQPRRSSTEFREQRAPIVPHRYVSLILLDTTRPVSPAGSGQRLRRESSGDRFGELEL